MALTRKNALFAGHEVGAENWALLASLLATCKLSDVDPAAYVAATLEAIINGHPQEPHRRTHALALREGHPAVKPRRIGGQLSAYSGSGQLLGPERKHPLV